MTSLDLWNNFQEKLAGWKWLFPVIPLSQQRYSSSLYFGNAWFCYDVNKESIKMHEFAMTLTQNLLNFEKYSWTSLSVFINFSATRPKDSLVEYSPPTHQEIDSRLSSDQAVKEL